MEPVHEEKTRTLEPSATQKPKRFHIVKLEEKRFRIVKLEERIAPKNTKQMYQTWGCGGSNWCTGHGGTCVW
jgi:hypothetical protein